MKLYRSNSLPSNCGRSTTGGSHEDEQSRCAYQRIERAFRKTFAGGKMVMTASVAALPDMMKASALVKLAEFDDFTRENDPRGEHDFLSFEHCNRTFFWKCDYYNKEMDGGSEDPADPDKTTRVGTLMFAEDY